MKALQKITKSSRLLGGYVFVELWHVFSYANEKSQRFLLVDKPKHTKSYDNSESSFRGKSGDDSQETSKTIFTLPNSLKFRFFTLHHLFTTLVF